MQCHFSKENPGMYLRCYLQSKNKCMCKAHLIKQTDQNIKLLLFDSACTKLIMNLKAEVNWVNRDPCRQFRETLFFFQLDKNTVFCTLILFSNLNELSDWVEIRLLLLGVVQNNLILHSKKHFFVYVWMNQFSVLATEDMYPLAFFSGHNLFALQRLCTQSTTEIW